MKSAYSITLFSEETLISILIRRECASDNARRSRFAPRMIAGSGLRPIERVAAGRIAVRARTVGDLRTRTAGGTSRAGQILRQAQVLEREREKTPWRGGGSGEGPGARRLLHESRESITEDELVVGLQGPSRRAPWRPSPHSRRPDSFHGRKKRRPRPSESGGAVGAEKGLTSSSHAPRVHQGLRGP